MGAPSAGMHGGSITVSRTQRIVVQAAVLFALWMVLSGTTNVYHVILGLVCALVVAWLNVDRSGSATTPFPLFQLFVYLPWLLSRIIMSSIHVAKLVLHPRLPIVPTLIPYRHTLRDHRAIVLLGNSVTLTPGTITVEASPQQLLVHAIDTHSATDLTSGQMERKVAAVFR